MNYCFSNQFTECPSSQTRSIKLVDVKFDSFEQDLAKEFFYTWIDLRMLISFDARKNAMLRALIVCMPTSMIEKQRLSVTYYTTTSFRYGHGKPATSLFISHIYMIAKY